MLISSVNLLVLLCGIACPRFALSHSCFPSSIELTFDFSLNCEDSNSTINPGIVNGTCTVKAKGESPGTVALRPIGVSEVHVQEFATNGNNLTLLSQVSLFRSFEDGDSFIYASPILNNGFDSPSVLSISAMGWNANGEPIQNSVQIKYTNLNNFVPILDVGTALGWLHVVSLQSQSMAQWMYN